MSSVLSTFVSDKERLEKGDDSKLSFSGNLNLFQ